MAAPKYAFNARYIGRQSVKGPFSDSGLSEVVNELRLKGSTGHGVGVGKTSSAHEEFRCNLEFCDRSLLITYIKKDEGFESDGESSSTTTSSGVPGVGDNIDTSNGGMEIKIIKDHVFGYGGGNETSSLDETSGADSGDDFAVRKSSTCSTTSNSSTSSPSASPTAELQKYKFDRKETYPIGDVLICHTDKRNLNCVVWVVRTPGGGSGGGLEALVFECFGEENVKDLYRKFLEVSKRSKLERHRRRRSDGGGSFSNNSHIEDPPQQYKSQNIREQQQQQQPQLSQARRQNNGLWNLVRHTDRNGITHIEVESHHRQNAENEKVSISIKKPSEKSKFAKELESILSKELENRRGEGRGLGSASPGTTAKIWGNRSTGEPQSLRQRAPALLLRKLDEFEEMAHRVWAGAPPDGDIENDNRKVWQRPDPSKAASRTPPPSSRRHHDLDGRRRERLERLRVELMQQKSEENMTNMSNMSNMTNISNMTNMSNKTNMTNKEALKVAAQQQQVVPSTNTVTPPAASTPTVTTSTTMTTPATTTATPKREGEKQILIPTKTGKEPVRKLYPKESPPDQIRTRFVPVAIPIQFTTAQQFSPQPLSLPIYPMQVAPVAWARYPGDFNDPNNNMNQIARAQWAAARVQVVPEQTFAIREARGRSRDRTDGGDQRRRAQSKSPARRPVASNGYLDNVASDMSELSKKFREFGDAVRMRMSRKSGGGVNGGPTQVTLDNGQLKSNLKKQRECGPLNGIPNGNGPIQSGCESLISTATGQTSNDNKKVHFNKFATVQMME